MENSRTPELPICFSFLVPHYPLPRQLRILHRSKFLAFYDFAWVFCGLLPSRLGQSLAREPLSVARHIALDLGVNETTANHNDLVLIRPESDTKRHCQVKWWP